MSISTDSFSKSSILVIGDIMLDRYLWSEVQRISPEAPVPIVRVIERSEGLGGAGNVARNLVSLKCKATIIGVRGSDEAGKSVEALLDRSGIKGHLLRDDSRPTITKTRIMVQNQQLLRLDEEIPMVLSEGLKEQLTDLIEKYVPCFRWIVLSDYNKGMLQTEGIAQRIIQLGRKYNTRVLIDPKGKDWRRYAGAACVTPNVSELSDAQGSAEDVDEMVLAASAQSVRKKYDLNWILVTRGKKGICLAGSKDRVFSTPARAREVFDVSGAGDTVIATLAAGLSTGLTFPEAAELANTAAGIVVGKLGVQPITYDELETELRFNGMDATKNNATKITSRNAAQMQIQAWRTSGNKIVFTNGCFDLLHAGHIYLLSKAKALGDKLIVGLNSDHSVRKLKGPNRPILPEQDRVAILSALSHVDMVVIFGEDTPQALIASFRPDVLVKGADYKEEEVLGREIVTSYGGSVQLVELLEGYSTSALSQKIRFQNDS